MFKFILFFILVIPFSTHADNPSQGSYDTTCHGNGFCSLADYSKSKLGDLYSTQTGDLSTFFNTFVTFAISIAGIFAVIQIVRGGYLYAMGTHWVLEVCKKQKNCGVMPS